MSVFEFSDFREFIKYRVSKQIYNSAGRKKSNLARVAKDLGYSSRSLLSMVMTGKRLPSEEFCESIFNHWKLSKKEREYFQLLVKLEKKQKAGGDTADVFEEIRRIATKRNIYKFKETDFCMVREWHHLVIKEMVDSPNFFEDPAWISKVLDKKITPSQAENSLKRMEQIGILARDNNNKLRVREILTETSHDIPSSSIRQHQKEMIQRALEAMDSRPIEERFFNTLVFKIDPRKLLELREFLLECVRKVNTDFSCSDTNSVYQLNLQFFEHTNFSNAKSLEEPNVLV